MSQLPAADLDPQPPAREAELFAGYSEFGAITSKNADGYYGWEGVGDFDKIIVTCGIDHVPPPLLQQHAGFPDALIGEIIAETRNRTFSF